SEPPNLGAGAGLQHERGGNLHRFDRYALRRCPRSQTHLALLNFNYRFSFVNPTTVCARREKCDKTPKGSRTGAHPVIPSRRLKGRSAERRAAAMRQWKRRSYRVSTSPGRTFPATVRVTPKSA